jgi:peptidoglycan-associated lipoprotein
MMRSARKAWLVLAVASALAAGCATENTNPEAGSAPATVSGTPPITAKSTAQQPPAQRMGSTSAAQVTPKSVPSQRSVYYDLDRFEVKPQFLPAIEAHARYLREHAEARVTIEGNGDERGSREYNLALGQRRAEAVRQLLRLSGAAEHQVEAVSLGEEKPRSLGHDEASWAQNRRSDLLYQRAE